jgi:hypothetical protein
VFGKSNDVFLATLTLASIGVVISSAEYLCIRREFRNEGVLAWRIFGSRPEILRRRSLLRPLAGLFCESGVVTLIVARLLAALGLLMQPSPGLMASILLATVTATSIAMSLRNIVGMDGADQMTVVVFTGLTVYALAGDRLVRDAALLFIAAQAILSYGVAGIAKAVSPLWRSGEALPLIMATRTYGDARVARALRRIGKRKNRMISWSIIALESSFIFAILLPLPVVLCLLAWGVVFHAANARLMGLNTFFWAFIATYPAILFCRDAIGL